MSDKIKKWIKAALIRAIKTVAQTAIATVGTAAVMGAVDWRMVASASIGSVKNFSQIGLQPSGE